MKRAQSRSLLNKNGAAARRSEGRCRLFLRGKRVGFLGGAGSQHVYDDPALEVDDNRSVSETLAPAPVIDRDGARGRTITTFPSVTFELAQNCIVADWYRQAPQQSFACPATSSVAEQSHNFADATSLSCKGTGCRKSFNEGLSYALLVRASPSPQAQFGNDRGALDWKILQAPNVPAVSRS